MSKPGKWAWVVGIVLHGLLAAMMILAGIMKLGSVPPEMAEALKKAGPGFLDQLRLIGVGEMVTAVLLILPWTSSLGVLVTSGFWGGAICMHLGQNEPYIVQSALLVTTWVGAFLRMPEMFSSFSPALAKDA